MERALLRAAGRGNLAKVKQLLEEGCPVNAQNQNGENALHLAAGDGHVSTIQYLAQHMGSLLHSTDNDGYTMLHWAAERGHSDVVKLVIDEYKLDPTARDAYGLTPVLRAAFNSHTSIVDLLVDQYHCSLTDVNNDGRNALHLAAADGHADTIRQLAMKMESLLHNTDDYGFTILHFAAQKGHAVVLQLAVDKFKLDPTACDKNGMTPVLLAAFSGHTSIVDLLVDQYHCSLTDVNNDGCNALHLAAEGGHADTIRQLAPKMQSLLHNTDYSGETMLHRAAFTGQAETVQIIIDEFQLDPTPRNKYGLTPVLRAAFYGHTSIVDLLVDQYHCSLTDVDNYGCNALHLAAAGGHPNTICQLSLKMESLLHNTDNYGFTMLHFAAREGHTEVVQLLIDEFQLDPTAHNKEGLTPVLLAFREGHSDLVDVLVGQYSCSMSEEEGLQHTFLAAAQNGDLDKVQELIAQGCSVNAKDQKGRNALHYAALGGHVSAIRYLAAKMQSEVHSADNDGFTMLHYAAQEDHTEVVQLLIDDYKLDPTARDKWGYTPVLRAAYKGKPNVMDVLERCYKCSLTEVANDGENALHLAAWGGHVSTIRYLAPKIESLLHSPDTDGYTMLHWAAVGGHAQVVQLVVDDYKLDPNARDKRSGTPLHKALNRNHLKVAQVLLQKGALAGFKDRDLVVEAVMHGDIDAAKRLLKVAESGLTENDCSELYKKAINDGPTITLHIAKAMTVGPPQVGKTCLRHLLLGLPPPENTPSTALMKTAETVSLPKLTETYVELDDEKWIPLSAISGIESLLTFLKEYTKVPKEVASHEQAKTLNPHTEVPPDVSGSDKDLESIHTAVPNRTLHDVSTVDKNTVKQPQKEHMLDHIQSLVSQMHQMLQSVKSDANITLPDAHLLQFIDCGGQLAYHDILPIFVNIPAIHLHVFNLTKGLTECPEDQICCSDGTKCFSAKSPLTVAQMMTRSMMAIKDIACKKLQLPEEVEAEGSLQPCVAFIGTHYDEFAVAHGDQTCTRLDDIGSKLPTVPTSSLKVMKHRCPDLPARFFPINNFLYDEKHSGGQDTKNSSLSTCCLKECIKKEVVGVKVRVPVKWYLYQLMEWGMKGKEKHRRVHKYGQLCKSCASIGITDKGDIYAMVTYFHALGLLIHLCGHESKRHIEDAEGCECLVFTDPSHLFENITKLYQVQFWREGDVDGCLSDLKSCGILTKAVLTELKVDIDHRCFMEILVQLFIGADIKSHEEDRTLFVPSVLTNPTDKGTPSGPGTRPQEQSLCFAITFKDTSFTPLVNIHPGYIPCGVFTGMIARLQSLMEWNFCRHSLSRIHVEFQVKARSTVKLYDHATHIGITVEGKDVKREDYHEYCSTIIKATADSYCFLFHSKHPRSEVCTDCKDRPYLILGQTCQKCTAPEAPHFAELKVEDRVPVSVRCQKNETKLLVGTERIPFEHILHAAVIEEQHTKPDQTEEKTGKDLPPYLPPSTPFPVTEILEKHETEFFSVINPRLSLMRLKRKRVISEDVESRINAATNKEDAQEILFAHLMQHANVNTLMKYCEVAVGADSYPKMQSLGTKMKEELQCMQRGIEEKERKGKRRKGKETDGTEPPSKKGREEKEIEGTEPPS